MVENHSRTITAPLNLRYRERERERELKSKRYRYRYDRMGRVDSKRFEWPVYPVIIVPIDWIGRMRANSGEGKEEKKEKKEDESGGNKMGNKTNISRMNSDERRQTYPLRQTNLLATLPKLRKQSSRRGQLRVFYS